MPTEADISDTIVAKSDQLNADDLVGGPITVTIAGVKRGPEDQPVFVSIGLKQADGKDKPWKPCKSMRRALVFAWGKDSTKWTGRSLCLVRDPTVKWAGEAVGGIRIKAMSHIESRLELSLAVSKGKKAKVVIEKLGDAPNKPAATTPAENELTASFNAMKAKWKSRREDRGLTAAVEDFRAFIVTATEGCVSSENALKIEKYTPDVIAHINEFIKVNFPEQLPEQ